jgi:hypothetical protein
VTDFHAAPDTETVDDVLDIDEERLRQFVADELGPTPSVALGLGGRRPRPCRHGRRVAPGPSSRPASSWARCRRRRRAMTPDTPDPEAWRECLADLDAPSIGELARVLADTRESFTLDSARDLVDDALADGVLNHNPDAGAFGTVSVAGDQKHHGGDDPGAETNVEARSLQAFAAAIEFFNSQLDRDIFTRVRRGS